MKQRKIDSKKIKLIVYDFDGVMTNDKVLMDKSGRETVVVNRSDGLAVTYIKKMNIPQIIISTEENLVVTKRAKKLKIPCIQGVGDKKKVLTDYLKSKKIDKKNVVYVGNDVNDLEAMKMVGFPIAPASGHTKVKRIAKIITTKKGGDGVVRELLDIIN